MTTSRGATAAGSQLPAGSQIFLDHVGHFVADPGAAAAALQRLGFTATPVSVQVNPDPAGGPPRPTGTGNVCAMMQRGYVEVLFKTAETPLGIELDTARHRYEGLHLVALAVADAEAAHGRLDGEGFRMQPLVRMQRPVGTAEGEGVAAFEVVRVAPGVMPEGRVQMLRHKTEDTVWQPRWLVHPNGATGLGALTIVVADVDEAAARFARFAGRPAVPAEGGRRIALDRGSIELMSAGAWRARWPQLAVPSLPFMGACEIEVRSLPMLARAIEAGGERLETAGQVSWLRFPPALGHGLWTFVEAA